MVETLAAEKNQKSVDFSAIIIRRARRGDFKVLTSKGSSMNKFAFIAAISFTLFSMTGE